jgi:hypothetical protein
MKMMGLGAAAAPIAVPHIGGLSAMESPLAGIAAAKIGLDEPTSSGGWVGSAEKAISKQALKALGVPKWLSADWDRQAQHVYGFDPDIASYRFMSLPAKLALQRKRNRQRIESEWWKPSPWREQEKWQEAHGYIRDD